MRSRKIMIEHQILLNFMVNSPRRVWRNTLKTLSEKYSVKNVNPRKKPHPNRLTLSNARASHMLKNLFIENSSRLLSCFGAAKLRLLQILIRGRLFLLVPFLKMITEKIYISAYHSIPLFIKNMKKMVPH